MGGFDFKISIFEFVSDFEFPFGHGFDLSSPKVELRPNGAEGKTVDAVFVLDVRWFLLY